VGAETAFIAPGSPWENGYCESFKSRFRDELLYVEVFSTLREAQILIEKWRRHYNAVTTIQSGRKVLWATVHQPQKVSCQWTEGRPCTNNQPDHSVGADHSFLVLLKQGIAISQRVGHLRGGNPHCVLIRG
jgi:hypothetical protein